MRGRFQFLDLDKVARSGFYNVHKNCYWVVDSATGQLCVYKFGRHLAGQCNSNKKISEQIHEKFCSEGVFDRPTEVRLIELAFIPMEPEDV